MDKEEMERIRIKCVMDEKLYIWGELKARFTGKFEEMTAVYHEICAGLTSERIGEGKDRRVDVIHSEKTGVSVVKREVIPKSVAVGEWMPTRNPDVEMRNTAEGKLQFRQKSDGHMWYLSEGKKDKK